MKIDYSTRFIKQLKKSPRQIKIAFRDRLKLFIKNRGHPLLHNHPLTGKFSKYRSINITGDWRAIFRQSKDEDTIIFEMIGTHSQLYR